MLAVRGVYDGKRFRVLPSEALPVVDREIPVIITFLEDLPLADYQREQEIEIAKWMRATRETMKPLGMNTKDLVEEGRERCSPSSDEKG